MATMSQSFWRDANRIPITRYGLFVKKSFSLTANGTVTSAIFTVTGTVNIRCLYGVVTTALGSNVTAAYWRLNDGSNQSNISLNTGTTLSSAGIGSSIVRLSVVGVALTLNNNTQERVMDPVAATAPDVFMPFVVTQMLSTTTSIEFCYTTNNTSLGAIDFYCGFIPVSSDGVIAAA
jgi:hypothetical protein